MVAWSGVGCRSRREQEQNRNRRATTTPSAKERRAPAGTPLMICFWGPRISIRTPRRSMWDRSDAHRSPFTLNRWVPGSIEGRIGGRRLRAVSTAVGSRGGTTAASSARRRRMLPCAMRRHHGVGAAGAGPKEEQRRHHGRWSVSDPPMVAAPSVCGVVGPVDRVAKSEAHKRWMRRRCWVPMRWRRPLFYDCLAGACDRLNWSIGRSHACCG